MGDLRQPAGYFVETHMEEGEEEAMEFLRKLPEDIASGRRRSVLVSVMDGDLVLSQFGVCDEEALSMLMHAIQVYRLITLVDESEVH